MLGIWILLPIAINGALFAMIPTAIVYCITKKHYPNWKILTIAGSIGGIIAVFFL